MTSLVIASSNHNTD